MSDKEKTLHKYNLALRPYYPSLMTQEDYDRTKIEKYLFRTMFLPPLHGNLFTIAQIKHALLSYDEVFVLGNFLGLEYQNNNRKVMHKINNSLYDEFVHFRMQDPRFQTLVGFNEIIILQDNPKQMLSAKLFGKLSDMWLAKEGILKVAATSKGRLVTPGGLSYGLWNKIGRPKTAGQAAAILNEIYVGKLYLGKSFRTNGKPNFAVDPVFANPLVETYPSWFYSDEQMPFGQIHGNETYNLKLDFGVASSILDYQDDLDYISATNFGTVTAFNQSFFIGVNCGLSPIVTNNIYDIFYPYNEVCELDKKIVDEYTDNIYASFEPWNNIENFEGIPKPMQKRKRTKGFYGTRSPLESSFDRQTVLNSLDPNIVEQIQRIEESGKVSDS